MDFLKQFEKTVDKMENVTGASAPPGFWYSSGNHVLNKIMSDSYYNCIGQSRILGLAGSSGSGKSFIAVNLMVNVQKEGGYNLVIDSENALSDDFVSKIGVDVDIDYNYKSLITISDTSKLVSTFIKGYKAEYSDDLENGKKVHITIDSLDMLLTDTELKNFNEGVSKGDQGQRNKQLKAMLRTFVQSIKGTNITMCITSQVYANQDILNGEGKWIVSDAVKYSLSQIILIDKLKLKDKKDTKIITGIRMKCTGYKTRFTKPFQVVTIEVPYETGMDPYSGLLEIAVSEGIVKQAGAWYTLVKTDTKFQSKRFGEFADEILNELESKETFLNVESFGDDEVDNSNNKDSVKKQREDAHLVEQSD